MAERHSLAPATELAGNNGVRFPHESNAYRRASNELLVEVGEMGFATAGPGQDMRGALIMPIWTILNSTPEGLGSNWYPRLEYGA